MTPADFLLRRTRLGLFRPELLGAEAGDAAHLIPPIPG